MLTLRPPVRPGVCHQRDQSVCQWLRPHPHCCCLSRKERWVVWTAHPSASQGLCRLMKVLERNRIRALVIWKCRNQWMLSYGRWTGCSEFVLFLLIQSLHPNYPLHCSSGPAGWCQLTAVFVPPLVWWIYVYRYVSCFPHHTCKKSQRQVALHSVQMETGNLSDSPHVSSWRRRKHPGFWLKGRWWPGLPRGKTIRSSLSVRLTQHIWLLGGLRFPLKESKALLGNQTS